MKRRASGLFLILVLAILSVTSCQKVKEPEGKKESIVQQRQEETTQRSADQRIDSQDKQEEPTVEDRLSLVTEIERKKIKAQFHGEILQENFKNEKEIVGYLRILLKGDHRSFRMDTPHPASMEKDDQIRRYQYGDVIGILLSYLNPKTNKDAFDMAVEILKTKRDYPSAMSSAARAVKFAKNLSVLPLLRETLKHSDQRVRLESAGSLLVLGDADMALPVLEELAEKEGFIGALYYLFSSPGIIIDARGYTIVEKALINPKAEVRITAVKLLLDSKKITKEKAEDISLSILQALKDKTIQNYGLMPVKPKESIAVKPLPGSNIDVDKSDKQNSSDSRACEHAASLLGQLRSSKALPVLKQIASRKTEWWHTCKWGIKEAIEAIEKPNGGPK